MNWKQNLLTKQEEIRELLLHTKIIAVLGIKTDVQQSHPAFYVPAYLARVGFEIIPVPVYYPDVKQILGRPVYRKLVEISSDVDLVNIFRRAEDIPSHLDDILAKRPTAVWFQLGIRNDGAAESLARAGIKVVQDRCLLVEHRSMQA